MNIKNDNAFFKRSINNNKILNEFDNDFLSLKNKLLNNNIEHAEQQSENVEVSTVSKTNKLSSNIHTIELKFGKNKQIDNFYALIDIHIKKSDNIKALYIYRSEKKLNNDLQNNLSLFALDKISSRDTESLEKRLSNNNIKNSLTLNSPFDWASAGRVATDGNIGNNVIQSDVDSVLSESADKSSIDTSVARDIKSIKNIGKLENSSINIQKSTVNLKKAEKQNEFVINTNTDFKKLAFLSVDNNNKDEIFSVFYEDNTITYGKKYLYYVVQIDQQANTSNRSKIIELDVTVNRIPERPSNVTINNIKNRIVISPTCSDFFVSKFEIFSKKITNNVIKEIDITRVEGKEGYVLEKDTSKTLSSGFILLGEVYNSIGASCNFVDNNALIGSEYTYRIYSVDCFGNKSESPYEIQYYFNDKSLTKKSKLPTIDAEIDEYTGKVKISILCEDKDIKMLFVGRKNHTLKQREFICMNQVSDINITSSKNSVSMLSEVLFLGNKEAWNGAFENICKIITFIDKFVNIDNIYQYRVYGIDKYGNKTDFSFSKNIMITSNFILPSVKNILVDKKENKIKLSWENSFADISAEDRLGDRTALSASIIRTLFSVEKKIDGTNSWQQFALTENNYHLDEIKNSSVYRIKTVQSGGFISNYSENIEVSVDKQISEAIEYFTVNVKNIKIKPFSAMLEWNSKQDDINFIDRWEILRFSANNMYSDKISEEDIKTLDYESFRVVYKESSRAVSGILDIDNIKNKHSFIDTSIELGNSYFYKIRVISVNNSKSDWKYSSCRLSSDTFDNMSIYIDTKSNFYNDNEVRLKDKFRGEKNSRDLIPNFSKPSLISKVKVDKKKI